MYKDRLEEQRISEEIRVQYIEHERARTLYIGRLGSLVAITCIILFILQDTYVLGFHEFVPWRILGIIPFILFLLCSFTVFKRYPALIIPMHAISLTGLISMMCGIITLLFMRDRLSGINLNPAATGLMVDIFAVLIFSAGAIRFLPAIIFLPMTALCAALFITFDITSDEWAILSNPALVAVIVSIYSIYQKGLNLREFSSMKRAELSDRIISIQHNSMSVMLDSIDESAFLMKPDGTIVYANRAMAGRLNLTNKLAAGMNVYDVTPEEVRESRRAKAAICLETKKPVSFLDERLGRSIQNSIHPVLDENNETVYLAVFGFDITERIHSENEIKQLLDQKKLLLKEIHHRVKNNMMSISGLLTLRSESDVNAECAAILKEMSGRVMAMMRIYDKLYRTEDYSHIYIREYLTGLLSEISRTFLIDDSIRILYDIEDQYISQNSVFAIGIIVNELVTNSLKYAFPDGRKGIINISLKQRDDNKVEIIIHDNGIGLPDKDTVTLKSGFGLDLVKIMAQQCGGTMDVSCENGTMFTIIITGM